LEAALVARKIVSTAYHRLNEIKQLTAIIYLTTSMDPVGEWFQNAAVTVLHAYTALIIAWPASTGTVLQAVRALPTIF
jgi:hypothetical protein